MIVFECATCLSKLLTTPDDNSIQIHPCTECPKIKAAFAKKWRKRVIDTLYFSEFSKLDPASKLIREYLWEAKRLNALSKCCRIDEELLLEPWGKYYVAGEHEYEELRARR